MESNSFNQREIHSSGVAGLLLKLFCLKKQYLQILVTQGWHQVHLENNGLLNYTMLSEETEVNLEELPNNSGRW